MSGLRDRLQRSLHQAVASWSDHLHMPALLIADLYKVRHAPASIFIEVLYVRNNHDLNLFVLLVG